MFGNPNGAALDNDEAPDTERGANHWLFYNRPIDRRQVS